MTDFLLLTFEILCVIIIIIIHFVVRNKFQQQLTSQTLGYFFLLQLPRFLTCLYTLYSLSLCLQHYIFVISLSV